jgi:fructose-1,6-bisphosphatase
VGRKNYIGGNRIRVQWFNNQSNLHVVWDESLISYQQLTYKDYAEVINHTTAGQRAAWQKQSIAEWMAESYLIAETLFPEIKEENQKLSYRYNFLHVATVNQQLLKGGVRLAGLLNEIFR